jgi:hypothetical protein
VDGSVSWSLGVIVRFAGLQHYGASPKITAESTREPRRTSKKRAIYLDAQARQRIDLRKP